MSGKIRRFSSIGIIGAGRLGCCLALGLIEEKYKLTAASSTNSKVKKIIEKVSTSTAVFSDPQEVIDASEIIFFTTKDDSISLLINSLSIPREKFLIHCSGSLSLNVLEKNKSGFKIGNFHPIQTFPNITSQKNLRNIYFSIDSSDSDLENWLKKVAISFNSDVIKIPHQNKDLYHAICVLNCALLVSLIGHSSKLWSNIGINSETGIKITLPMIKTTLQSILDFGSFEALSGPLIRGDLETIKRNITVLGEHSEYSKKIYILLSSMALDMDSSKFNLSKEKFGQIKQILQLND